jgi:hypothetical protein
VGAIEGADGLSPEIAVGEEAGRCSRFVIMHVILNLICCNYLVAMIVIPNLRYCNYLLQHL